MGEKARLGETLVADGLISEHQLRAALGEQARWGHRLGETLVEMGFLPEADLVRTLTRLLGLPGIDLDGKRIEANVLARVPGSIAEKYRCLPLFEKREQGADVLYLGMDEPTNLAAVDEVSFQTGLVVKPVVVGPVQLRHALAEHYRGDAAPAAGRPSLAEAPVGDGDTAPLVTREPDQPRGPMIAGESVFEAEPEPVPQKPALEPEPAPKIPAPEPVGATSPTLPPELTAPQPASVEAGSGGDRDEASSPSTRQILQALVKLLIDKQVISRRELLEAVDALARDA